MSSSNELSARNPHVREAANLLQKKFRRQAGRILIEGLRLVSDALDSGANVLEILCTATFLDSPEGRGFEPRGLPVTRISEAAAARLSDTRTPQGLFAVVQFSLPTLSEVGLGVDALVLVADGIADPGNLGTIIRSAAALGAAAVVATGDSCEPLNPKTVRATMGAIFRIPVVADLPLADAARELKSRGLQIVAAVARQGKPPWELDLDRPTALLIGSESDGLSPEAVRMSDALATIPMHRGTESLNAALAAAAMLYEAARQRQTLA